VDDAGSVIADSWRIAEHLEARYADRPSLFGGPVGHGLARFINHWVDRGLIPRAAPMLMADVISCVDATDAAHLRAQIEKAFGKTLEAMRDARDAGVKDFQRSLDPARATLKAQPYLSGPAPAYPDYILFSLFQWARIVSDFDLIEAKDAVLTTWRARILDLFDGLARREPARK
jgi:glutathione S-transferase